MRKHFIIAIIGLAVALSYSLVFAGECKGDKLKVEIEGNNKTKESTILRLAFLKGECVPDNGLDPAFIKQELLNSHLFSDVQVEVKNEAGVAIVHITVKDKWSIIPIPQFYTSSEQSGGGVLMLESNLLGRKKMLVAGGAYSNIGNRYEGIYIDDAVMGSKFIFILRPLYIDRLLFKFEDEEEVYAMSEKFTLLFAILGYRVTEHIAPAFGIIYRYRDLQKAEDYDYAAPPNERSSNGAMANLRFGNMDFVDYYDKGFMGTLVLEHSLQMLNADKEYGHFVASFDVVYPVWKMLSRSFVEGGWSMGKDACFTNYYRLGGEVGRRGIPDSGLWVRDYVSVSEQIEQVVYRHKYGIFTVAGFFDDVFTNQVGKYQSYPAAGGGLRVYLKDIAIPAIGVDAGYSLNTTEWHISAYAGKVF